MTEPMTPDRKEPRTYCRKCGCFLPTASSTLQNMPNPNDCAWDKHDWVTEGTPDRKEEATPRPWKDVLPVHYSDKGQEIRGANGEHVASWSKPIDAKLMVEAVNSYDTLRAEVERLKSLADARRTFGIKALAHFGYPHQLTNRWEKAEKEFDQAVEEALNRPNQGKP